jgi:hypothetical protein
LAFTPGLKERNRLAACSERYKTNANAIRGESGKADFVGWHSEPRPKGRGTSRFLVALARLCATSRRQCCTPLTLNEHVAEDDLTVFAHACQFGAEGVASMKLNGTYRSGRSRFGSSSQSSEQRHGGTSTIERLTFYRCRSADERRLIAYRRPVCRKGAAPVRSR